MNVYMCKKITYVKQTEMKKIVAVNGHLYRRSYFCEIEYLNIEETTYYGNKLNKN